MRKNSETEISRWRAAISRAVTTFGILSDMTHSIHPSFDLTSKLRAKSVRNIDTHLGDAELALLRIAELRVVEVGEHAVAAHEIGECATLGDDTVAENEDQVAITDG